MIKNLLLAALATSATIVHAAQPMMVRYETPIETSVSQNPIPSQVPETLVVRPCPACSPLTLRITPNTRFFVNKKQVDLTELRQQAVGDRFMGIYYLEETSIVTRVVIAAQ